MKKLILALAILATSIGFADAHPAKHHLARTPWQANAVAMQKTSQPCFAAQGQPSRACGTPVLSADDFSQFNDH
jgi:hypothetical protein